jgi:hypothetical protein
MGFECESAAAEVVRTGTSPGARPDTVVVVSAVGALQSR